MLGLNFHRHHLPPEHFQLQSFQFIATQRARKAAVAFSEKFRYLVKRAEAGRMSPFIREAGHKAHIGFAVITSHVHGRTVRVFTDLKPSMVMNSREKTPAEQLDQSLVRFTTPNK